MNETIQTLIERRSCRKYRPEQVKEEDLKLILKAGTYAASGMGRQSAQMVVLQDPEEIREVERLNAGVMGNEDGRPFYGAPAVVIVFADSAVRTYEQDGNLVIGNLMNAAWSLHVDSCYINRAKEVFAGEAGRALKKKWGVADSMEGIGNVILGYGEPDGIRPAAPRKEDYIIRR